MELVKSEQFGMVTCDVYRDGSEFFMTREQIGAALEYANPQKAIGNMHASHKARIDKFSFLDTRNGREIYFYNRKGIMEICRWSQQPKADEFMDFTWNVMDSLISGEAALISNKPTLTQAELIAAMAQNTVELERKLLETASRVETVEAKVDKALDVLSRPNADTWVADMNRQLDGIIAKYGGSIVNWKGRIYDELERECGVNIQSRLTKLQKRMREHGMTYRDAKALNKMDAIGNDKKLRAAFEGIVRRQSAIRVSSRGYVANNKEVR